MGTQPYGQKPPPAVQISAQGEQAVVFQQIPTDMIPQSVRLGLSAQLQNGLGEVRFTGRKAVGQGSGSAAVEHAAV